MKFSKKIRFLFSLTSLLICLCLGNVVVYADEMIMPQEEMETSLDDVITYANGKISLSQAKTLAEQWVSMATQLAGVSYDEQLNLGEIYSSQTDFFENFAKTAGEEGCGQYISYDDVKVEETDNKGKVDITAVIHFEKKNLRMTMHTMCFETS